MPAKVFEVWKMIKCQHACFDEFICSLSEEAAGFFTHAYTNCLMSHEKYRVGESKELVIVDRSDLNLRSRYDIHDLSENVKASGLQTIPKFMAPQACLLVWQTAELRATVYVYEPGIDRCCHWLYRSWGNCFIENSMYACDRLDDQKIVLCR